jgi:aspartate/methionine/tyrosine aminotransferase
MANFDVIDLSIGKPYEPCQAVVEDAHKPTERATEGSDDRTNVPLNAKYVFQAADLGRFHPVPKDLDVFPTQGIRGGLNVFLQSLAHAVRIVQRETEIVLRPAIVLPVPTFGELATHMELDGFDVIQHPLKESEDWELKPDALARTVTAAEKSHPHSLVVAVGEMVIRNPEGQFNTLGKILPRYQEILKLNVPHGQKLLELAGGQEKVDHFSAANPAFKAAFSILSRIITLEDGAYVGTDVELDLNPAAAPAAFYYELAKRYPRISDDVVSFLSTSKLAGTPSLHAGVMVAGKELGDWIKPFAAPNKHPIVYPAHRAIHACFDPNDPLYPDVQEHALKTRVRNKVGRDAVAKATANGGIPGVRMMKGGNAGWFCVLEFNEERWKPFVNHHFPGRPFEEGLPLFLEQKLGVILTPHIFMLSPMRNCMRLKCEERVEVIQEALHRLQNPSAYAAPLLSGNHEVVNYAALRVAAF